MMDRLDPIIFLIFLFQSFQGSIKPPANSILTTTIIPIGLTDHSHHTPDTLPSASPPSQSTTAKSLSHRDAAGQVSPLHLPPIRGSLLSLSGEESHSTIPVPAIEAWVSQKQSLRQSLACSLQQNRKRKTTRKGSHGTLQWTTQHSILRDTLRSPHE